MSYVGEVAGQIAVVVHVDRLSLQDSPGEFEHGHVDAAPRTVDGEEAQSGRGEMVKVSVAVRHQLVALLGRGVQADRLVYRIVRGERHPFRIAVHART